MVRRCSGNGWKIGGVGTDVRESSTESIRQEEGRKVRFRAKALLVRRASEPQAWPPDIHTLVREVPP